VQIVVGRVEMMVVATLQVSMASVIVGFYPEVL
jgi:hypothetical protein